MTKLVIWGAGGHGKVVLDIVLALQRWKEVVFVDDQYPAEAGPFLHRPVRPATCLESLRQAGFVDFIVAVGNNLNRQKCYDRALAHNLSPVIAIHPSSVISPSATVGSGTVVMPRAVINAAARIGVNCIVNTGAILEHDCSIGDHSHVGPGAAIGGGAATGRFSFIGINASILPFARVGENAIVGAGAVVLKEVLPGQTVAGVPAAPIDRKPMVEAPK